MTASSTNPNGTVAAAPVAGPDGDIVARSIRACRASLFTVFVFSLGVNLLMLAAPMYMLQVFDRVLTSRSTETLLFLTLMVGMALVVLWLLEMMRSRVMISVGIWLNRRLSGSVLRASVIASLGREGAKPRSLRDLAAVRDYLTGPTVFPLFDAPWVPVFLIVVFLLHPLLGGISIAGAIVLFLLAVINDRMSRSRTLEASRLHSQASAGVDSVCENADAVVAMGMLDSVEARWHEAHDSALEHHRVASGRIFGFQSFARMIRFILQIGLLGTGAWLVLANELTAGGMIAASILMARALQPVEQAIGAWRSAINARAAYRRTKEILEAYRDEGDPVDMPAPQGLLSARAVSFAFPGRSEPFIRNVSFELEPGQGLGLIGPTASGKSTLARLIVGTLAPQMGDIRLDGVSIHGWPSGRRGRHIGYLPQNIELFSGKVWENITRLGPRDDESIIEAARMVNVHEMILALPSGYETEVGPGGLALSGGQRQRIALARALYCRPALIVLDEPNASLDQAGENALMNAIDSIKAAGSTMVVVSHRSNILRSMDMMLVLRGGAVDLYGPREKVLAKVTGPARPSVVRGNG